MSKTIEERYQKKSQHEHILLRPQVYIGSIDITEEKTWIYDDLLKKIVHRKIVFVPILYKIFDEIITNACDHTKRCKDVSKIKVIINKETGKISVENNGKGIEIEIHKGTNVYLPEMIFGHINTSSNYNDNIKRIVGGLNGLGAKLTNIFSTKFKIETVYNGQKYSQLFEKNMFTIHPPKIKKYNKSTYTKITFTPDYKRLGIDGIDDVILSLLKKRIYDIAACTEQHVSVFMNGKKLIVKSFENYINLYIGMKKDYKRVYQRFNDRWEVAVCKSPSDKFQQISFVNGIYTSQGGTHVNYIINQIVNTITKRVQEKHKKLNIKKIFVKNQFMIFINCSIENPNFKSQTKEHHTTLVSKFGSKCKVDEKFIESVVKLGIIENIIDLAKFSSRKEIGSKNKQLINILGIPKLDDANKAGNKKESQKCTLIITEGDSAKTFAVSGLSAIKNGRDYIGIFPIRGKFINVKKASYNKLSNNIEFNHIIRILGLEPNKKYTTINQLRYGRMMILTDADDDGRHIKGLLICLIHSFWPELLNIEGYICTINTPVVKLSKGSKIIPFYNLTDLEKWKSTNNVKGWKEKYYKGLGTSKPEEAKEYFKQLDELTASYYSKNKKKTEKAITLAFGNDKKNINQRKEWINNNVIPLNCTEKKITYKDFINKDLILFSKADNIRSIPDFMDGLKPCQRKILYACFKRNLKDEIKVSQLAGYISEQTSYHHGEASLFGTIINMAQDFPGSNNINLLKPIGQFGSRLMNGKDASSPRYIFTSLDKKAFKLFHPNDTSLLEYNYDGARKIEPIRYYPVLPMVLINGAEGIGTGYSTFVPRYNPTDIITNIKLLFDKLNDSNIESLDSTNFDTIELNELTPWYKGFNGTITKIEGGKYECRGIYKRLNMKKIEVSEIPFQTSLEKYKEFLEDTIIKNKETKNNNHIISYVNHSTEINAKFVITYEGRGLTQLIKRKNVYKELKLTKNISINNMHLFVDGKIKKFKDPNEILIEFFKRRYRFYIQRKEYLIKTHENELSILNSKIKFIKMVMDDEIKVFRVKKNIIIQDLIKHKFPKFKENNNDKSNYNYLLNIKIIQFTYEKIKELEKKCKSTKKELKIIKETTYCNMWRNDIHEINI